MRKVWRSVRLFVAFHKDRQKRARRIPYLWPPSDAQAGVTDKDTDGQEAFVLVKGASGSERDVQIKVRPDKIILRRDDGPDWSGIIVTDHGVAVRVGDHWVEVRHDGSVKREAAGETTFLEADGTIFRFTDFAEIIVSPQGDNISRRTPEGIAAITPDGVLVKDRRPQTGEIGDG